MIGFNPIALVGTSIDSQGEIINGVTPKAPDEYQYDWEDISKSNAGRTQDITMNKNRMGRVISLSLGWEKISIKDCSEILNIFNNEYVYVKYLDALQGKFITRGFYTGNVTAPLFNTAVGKWEKLSFRISTRKNAL